MPEGLTPIALCAGQDKSSNTRIISYAVHVKIGEHRTQQPQQGRRVNN